MADKQYISKITLPAGTYHIKDQEARDLIARGQLHFVLAVDAATTPQGVVWDDEGTTVTGTLPPYVTDTSTTPATYYPQSGIYLVPSVNTLGKDIYDEYVAVQKSNTGVPATDYAWEKLGDTDIALDVLGDLVTNVTLTSSTDNVLGERTTFVDPLVTANVSLSTANFVNSVSDSTQKLVTTSIKPAGDDKTVTVIDSSAPVSVSYVVPGDPVTAHAVSADPRTATNTVYTAVSASAITSVPTISVVPAVDNGEATKVTWPNGVTKQVAYAATVSDETLTLSFTTAAQASIAKVGTATNVVSGVSYTAVDASRITSNIAVTADKVTLTPREVPVLTITQGTATAVSTKSTTLVAPPSANVNVATGALATNGAGASVVTGITSTVAAAVTGVTATVPSHNITVGTNDIVGAVTATTITVTHYDGSVTGNNGN